MSDDAPPDDSLSPEVTTGVGLMSLENQESIHKEDSPVTHTKTDKPKSTKTHNFVHIMHKFICQIFSRYFIESDWQRAHYEEEKMGSRRREVHRLDYGIR